VRPVFKYGTLNFDGAKVGDSVRFVNNPSPGQPGAILLPRGRHEINAVLQQVQGTMGYVEVKPQLASPQAVAESGSAAGIRVELPVSVRGSLRIS